MSDLNNPITTVAEKKTFPLEEITDAFKRAQYEIPPPYISITIHRKS